MRIDADIPVTSPGGGNMWSGLNETAKWRLRADTLTSKKLSEEQIEGVRKRSSRHFNTSSTKGVVGYYRRQNDILENFSEVDTLMQETMPSSALRAASSNGGPTPGPNTSSEILAMRISFGFNMILFAAKIFCALASGSLSIITSALDSFLDLVSGIILFVTARSMRRDNKYRFPAGKSRMQPLGIIVFSCIMGTVGFQVLLEAMRQLIGKAHIHHLESLDWLLGIMCSVIAVKFVLYLYCRHNTSDLVRIYAEDHRNDVLTNAIGLAGAVAGDKIVYWIDPLGAMLLAAYLVYNWGNVALENVKALVGLSASPEFLQKLTFLCYNHHSDVMKIDTVRAYTFGPRLIAEVDVVLPKDMPLQQAHDIGESLQNRIEAMAEIERAFVHLDFECEHSPEHDTREFTVPRKSMVAETLLSNQE
eukprot:CAMPEP_0196575770 /NCGR_PEP_ID=MMETSP1081-20130531/5179_1 /TAXON_ID=36882 /ORGANISM="Pyramimonas amylifera, Strain CCMP720" /LENGTH=418 /DNA_ID=CAMNT_0041894173 /DNA_START=341 /DNA_END=1597 /DNA_ORIENTATION=+